MRITGKVGPQNNALGVETDFRLEASGAVVVAPRYGSYHLETLRGNMFYATMTAGVQFPAPAATAANVCTLFNPLGSKKYIAVVSFTMITTVIPTVPVNAVRKS